MITNLKQLIKESYLKFDDCNCGKLVAPLINESKKYEAPISEALRYHVENKLPITENIFRAGSLSHVSLLLETRQLFDKGIIVLNGKDKWLFENTDLGYYGDFEGKMVPLDLPLITEDTLTEDNIAELEKIKKEIEALMPRLRWIDDVTFSDFNGDLDIELDYELNPQEIKQLSQVASKYDMRLIYKIGKNATLTKRRIPSKLDELNEAKDKPKKKNPPIGKPKRGGSKKFYVYVRVPGGKIKKVSFGDTTGLRAKLNNPKARQAFAKRHDCANKKDRTKASYWSCRIPRYSKLLGFKTTFTGYW
jgi:hypothetical protein